MFLCFVLSLNLIWVGSKQRYPFLDLKQELYNGLNWIYDPLTMLTILFHSAGWWVDSLRWLVICKSRSNLSSEYKVKNKSKTIKESLNECCLQTIKLQGKWNIRDRKCSLKKSQSWRKNINLPADSYRSKTNGSYSNLSRNIYKKQQMNKLFKKGTIQHTYYKKELNSFNLH